MDDTKKVPEGQQHKKDADVKEKKKSADVDVSRKNEGIPADGRKGVDTTAVHETKAGDKSASGHAESASTGVSPRGKSNLGAKPADGVAGGPKELSSHKVLPKGAADQKPAERENPVEEEAPQQGQQVPLVQKGSVASALGGKSEKIDNKKMVENEGAARIAEEADARQSTAAEAESRTKEKEAQQAVGAEEPAKQEQPLKGGLEAAQKSTGDEVKKESSRKAEPSLPARNEEAEESSIGTSAVERAEPNRRAEEEVGAMPPAEEEAAAAAAPVDQAEAEGASKKRNEEKAEAKEEPPQSDASGKEGLKKGGQPQKDGARKGAEMPEAAGQQPAAVSGQADLADGVEIPVVAKDEKAVLATDAPGNGAAVQADARDSAGVNGVVRQSEPRGPSPPVAEADSPPKSADAVESSKGVEVGRLERDAQASSSEPTGGDEVSEPSSHPIALVGVPLPVWLMHNGPSKW